MSITNSSTVAEVKKYLKENWEAGTYCPCCKQNVKLYERPISSTAAYDMILVHKYMKKHPELNWLHIPDYLGALDIPAAMKHTGEFSKLAHWGLIEYRPVELDEDKKCSGYARLTRKGQMFVEGQITVPKYAYIYNKKVYEYSDEQVNIEDCQRKKFSYNELMGREINISANLKLGI